MKNKKNYHSYGDFSRGRLILAAHGTQYHTQVSRVILIRAGLQPEPACKTAKGLRNLA
jgi:hypothetical protein